jgi:hypothetical protein
LTHEDPAACERSHRARFAPPLHRRFRPAHHGAAARLSAEPCFGALHRCLRFPTVAAAPCDFAGGIIDLVTLRRDAWTILFLGFSFCGHSSFTVRSRAQWFPARNIPDSNSVFFCTQSSVSVRVHPFRLDVDDGRVISRARARIRFPTLERMLRAAIEANYLARRSLAVRADCAGGEGVEPVPATPARPGGNGRRRLVT